MKRNSLLRRISITALATAFILSVGITYGLSIANTNPDTGSVTMDMVEIVKSPSDKSEYRYLELDNGIKVVLVSYPETEMASAAIAVNAGSSQEPDEWPGLAHLLEHTLFLGSEKYPDPSSFDAYIHEHGGGDNAWTGADETVYYFSINQNYLFPALDRLSQFFIAPQLDASWIDKERHAVDSEYQIYRQDEFWQKMLVQQATINQNHPTSRFSIGTLDTLQDHDDLSLQAALREFHQQWYVSENMAIVLVSSFSLDEMTKQVNQLLGDIPRKTSPERAPEQLIYTANEQGKRIDIQTATHAKSLELLFPLKINPGHRELGSGYFITYLLGHEGAGSLYNVLMNKGWIQGLFANYSHEQPNTNISVTMQLTDDGYQHIEEIVSLVFDDIQLIKAQGISKGLFMEQQYAADLAFQFMERADPETTAIYLILGIFKEMFKESPKELIRSNYALGTFAPQKIHNILAQMRPERMVMVVSSEQPLPVPDSKIKTEPWSGTQYSVSRLTKKQLAQFRKTQKHDDLRIPTPNPYMPEQLRLNREQEQSLPQRQQEYAELNVWTRHDQSFDVPKTFMRVRLYDHNAPTPQEQMHAALFSAILQDELAEQRFLANVAGLDLGFWKDNHGVILTIDGYTEKMPQFLATALATISNLKIKPALLQRHKEQLREQFEDDELNDPPYFLFRAFDQLTDDASFSPQQQLEALTSISVDSLQEWTDRVLHGAGASTMINGNASARQRTKLLEILSSYVTAGNDTDAVLDTPRFAQQQPKQNTCYVSYVNDNHALAITQSSTERELKDRALYKLLAHLISTPFYAKLRTDEQLGYMVTAHAAYSGDQYPLLTFVIESPDHKPEYLNERITAFFQNFETELSHLSKESLAEIQKTLVAEVIEPAQDLFTQSEIFWNNLRQGYTNFDGTNQFAQAIEEITPEQIRALFKQVVDNHRVVKLFGYGQESVPDDSTLMKCDDPAFAEQVLVPAPATER